jgi:hypothetical protein
VDGDNTAAATRKREESPASVDGARLVETARSDEVGGRRLFCGVTLSSLWRQSTRQYYLVH